MQAWAVVAEVAELWGRACMTCVQVAKEQLAGMAAKANLTLSFSTQRCGAKALCKCTTAVCAIAAPKRFRKALGSAQGSTLASATHDVHPHLSSQ